MQAKDWQALPRQCGRMRLSSFLAQSGPKRFGRARSGVGRCQGRGQSPDTLRQTIDGQGSRPDQSNVITAAADASDTAGDDDDADNDRSLSHADIAADKSICSGPVRGRAIGLTRANKGEGKGGLIGRPVAICRYKGRSRAEARHKLNRQIATGRQSARPRALSSRGPDGGSPRYWLRA